jgi:hypothetical protein
MKLQSCLMIKCIGPNKINVQELSIKLEEYVKIYFPNAHIILKRNEPYWKEPGYNEFLYSFSNNQFVKVSEFIKNLPLSWDYSEGEYYCINDNKETYNERAIWSQLCYPEETFLNSNIDWVHIYTWEEADASTANHTQA